GSPMRRLEGRDPLTGHVVAVDIDGETVGAVRRLGRTGDASLPYVTPGLIDLQVNGFAGHDLNGPDVTIDDVVQITDDLARVGVTTWVPTIITASGERIGHALDVVARA